MDGEVRAGNSIKLEHIEPERISWNCRPEGFHKHQRLNLNKLNPSNKNDGQLLTGPIRFSSAS